jgi:predicted Holliday junction resolvase-like endonuclease
VILYYATSFILICVILYQGLLLYQLQKSHREERSKLTEQWTEERKDLINRIQARDYGEYKQAEIRVIKAQKDEPPKPKLEML